ncbi:hypothetical protein LZ198_33090 [Myxococcus sp. K15C18031901]|uniref:hypothetical protein n=1 Tax=Myxococcus dinghuensis TaxID=2906761 RepID=UPI0020A83606|nr:hypothetical protein [Myxococcus dinghuensis]MCP3103730.1 hypothetical protein [Myxococcus dinghuensis]
MAPIRRAATPTPSAVNPPTVAPAPQPPPPPPPPPAQPRRDAGHSGRSSFQQPERPRRMDLSGGVGMASTLRTEVLGDGKANCLEKANTLSQPGDQVLLLGDSRDSVGHALVRKPGGAIVDPNEPGRMYSNLAEWKSTHPAYGQPVAVPDAQLARILSVPPGPAREALIHGFGLTGAASRKVADDAAATAGAAEAKKNGSVTPKLTLSTDGTIEVGITAEFKPEGELEKQRKDGELKGTLTGGPYAETQVTLNWNPTQPNADGRHLITVTFEATGGAKAGAGIEAGTVGPFGAEVGGDAGIKSSASFQLALTEGEIGELVMNPGGFRLPTLSDPLAMPPGSKLVMDVSDFKTLSSGLSIGPLKLSGENGKEKTRSVAVERTGDTTVRVTVGPEEALTSKLELGLEMKLEGHKVGGSLGSERSYTEGTSASVEFDLGTPEGRTAYETFVRDGTLPTQTGPGVLDVRTQQTYSEEASLSGELNLTKFVGIEHSFWDERLTETVTTVNGQTTVTAEGKVAGSDSTFEIQFSLNPDGSKKFEAMSMEVRNPDGVGFTTINVTGAEGLANVQDVAARQAQGMVMGYYADSSDPAAIAAERQRLKTEGEPFSTLAMTPDDPGYSHDAWLAAYREASFINGSVPNLPATTMNLMEATPEGLAQTVFQGLGTAVHVDQNPLFTQAEGPVASYTMPGWIDLGLGQRPGVEVK